MSRSAAARHKMATPADVLKLSLIALVVGFFLGTLLMLLVQKFFSLEESRGGRLPAAAATREAKESRRALDDALDEDTEEAIEDLRSRELDFPVQGQTLGDTRDTFSESRTGHIHEAIDILAPRNTPVVAVEDGKIAKLWYSKYGGVTIYQFDPDEKYAYYYAHLENYAWNLSEGASVEQGEVIGYVGSSGNAPPDTPHLHFAIFKLNEEKHWWEGKAINPFEVFKP